MCTTAFKTDTHDEVDCIGDLKKFCSEIIPISLMGDEGLGGLGGDEFCLCGVDVQSTLEKAGYKVWANPDHIPEWHFEGDGG